MSTASGNVLDLNICHYTRRHGDITAYGTWLYGEQMPYPALVLLRNTQSSAYATIPVAIPLEEAWVWSEEIGDPEQAAQKSIRYATVLGLDTSDIGALHRVGTIIRENLWDWTNIPALPPQGRVVVADGTVISESGRATTSEILDYL